MSGSRASLPVDTAPIPVSARRRGGTARRVRTWFRLGGTLLAALLAASCHAPDPRDQKRAGSLEVFATAPTFDELERNALLTQAGPPQEWTIDTGDGRKTKFYPTKLGKAAVLQKLITKHCQVGEVTATANYDATPEGANISDLLIVTGTDAQLVEVDRFIDLLEARAPQIEVKVRVVEISNMTDVQLGVNLLLREAQSLDAGGTPIGNSKTLFNEAIHIFDTQAFTEAMTAGSLFQGTLLELGTIHDELAVDILLQAVARESNAEILSAPRVTVLNGYTAEIKTVERIPYLTSKIQGNYTFLETKYKDAGITLTVTPFVVSDDTIQMIVRPEVSALTSFTEAVRGAFQNPIISTRNASTVINVRHGSTYVIGGLITNSEFDQKLKTPILGDIPLVGALFSTTRHTKTYGQLLFFITPRIIGAAGDTSRILVPR